MLTGIILIDIQRAFDIFNHELKKKKKGCITGFSFHFSKKIFLINIENPLPDYGRISCVVPQDSIVGPLFFLIYINAMPPVAETNLFLQADDLCLMFQRKDLVEIEKILNNNIKNTLTGLLIIN